MKNAKKKNAFIHPWPLDQCIGCKKKFKTGVVKSLYKDVVECHHCGKIWVVSNRTYKNFFMYDAIV